MLTPSNIFDLTLSIGVLCSNLRTCSWKGSLSPGCAEILTTDAQGMVRDNYFINTVLLPALDMPVNDFPHRRKVSVP